MSDLAVVVDKPRAEAAIAALQEEGVYDTTRRVVEHDADAVELPVTAAPAETDVRGVVTQAAPQYRATGLDSRLRERGWSEEEVGRAPSSWAVLGSVVLVTFEDCPDERTVADALLELHGEADTVLATEGVSGTMRRPEVRVVAGLGDTETVHTEHGVRYGMDLSKVMFSPGNKAERARMAEVVSDGERVFDMFAGIGYFSLPMAKAGADVTAAEMNPEAFRYLIQNAVMNDVQDRLDAFNADCREVDVTADRVVMGYYEATDRTYLDRALEALEPGGVVHVHEATPENRLWDRPVGRLREAAAAHGRDVEVLERRTVKSHSEGVWHVVVDARIT